MVCICRISAPWWQVHLQRGFPHFWKTHRVWHAGTVAPTLHPFNQNIPDVAVTKPNMPQQQFLPILLPLSETEMLLGAVECHGHLLGNEQLRQKE